MLVILVPLVRSPKDSWLFLKPGGSTSARKMPKAEQLQIPRFPIFQTLQSGGSEGGGQKEEEEEHREAPSSQSPAKSTRGPAF
ncbi:hypothetical protein ACLOJK_031456 [Asimina triloba]